MAVRNSKPKFGFAELWGACARCNARVAYNTLERERLTGLLVCGPRSGRPVNYCLDPWPAVYDFQAHPDRSIEPPPEPMPLRYNLDDIWGSGPPRTPESTTNTFANAPAAAPDDATRLARLLNSVPHYLTQGSVTSFQPIRNTLANEVRTITTIVPAEYDGTFVPSSGARTVVPSLSPASAVNESDPGSPGNPIVTPPWAVRKGV